MTETAMGQSILRELLRLTPEQRREIAEGLDRADMLAHVQHVCETNHDALISAVRAVKKSLAAGYVKWPDENTPVPK